MSLVVSILPSLRKGPDFFRNLNLNQRIKTGYCIVLSFRMVVDPGSTPFRVVFEFMWLLFAEVNLKTL